jgi:hypothetical protein
MESPTSFSNERNTKSDERTKSQMSDEFAYDEFTCFSPYVEPKSETTSPEVTSPLPFFSVVLNGFLPRKKDQTEGLPIIFQEEEEKDPEKVLHRLQTSIRRSKRLIPPKSCDSQLQIPFPPFPNLQKLEEDVKKWDFDAFFLAPSHASAAFSNFIERFLDLYKMPYVFGVWFADGALSFQYGHRRIFLICFQKPYLRIGIYDNGRVMYIPHDFHFLPFDLDCNPNAAQNFYDLITIYLPILFDLHIEPLPPPNEINRPHQELEDAQLRIIKNAAPNQTPKEWSDRVRMDVARYCGFERDILFDDIGIKLHMQPYLLNDQTATLSVAILSKSIVVPFPRPWHILDPVKMLARVSASVSRLWFGGLG